MARLSPHCKSSVGVCLLFFGALGCGKTDSRSVVDAKPTESTTAEGKRFAAAGVSLTFPADWQTIDMTQGQLGSALDALAKNPRGAEMAQAAKAVAQTGAVKLIVFDPGTSVPGFMNNVNLVVTPGANGLTLDQALDLSKAQLTALDPHVSVSKTTFPAGEFGRIESHLKTANGIPYVAIGYVQIGGNDLDVVTFSCAAGQVAAFDAKSQSIMKTFKRT